MKTMELFCASPASTSICSSIDQSRVVRRAVKSDNDNGSHRNRLPKPTTTIRTITAPPHSSQIPYSPTHSSDLPPRKSHTKSANYKLTNDSSRRKSSADVRHPSPPSTSSRYLLSESPIFDFLSENENVNNEMEIDKNYSKSNDFPVFKSSPSPPPIEFSAKKSSHLSDIIAYNKALLSSSKQLKSPSNTKELIDYRNKSPQKSTNELSTVNTSLTQLHNKIVELKVSIHCRGCEGKIRKHISRMEGVTWFSIDLETKKVTIVGNVTPLGVLSSVSKVKFAQFWPSQSSSSSSSTTLQT